MKILNILKEEIIRFIPTYEGSFFYETVFFCGRWAGHVARMGKNRNVYMLLVGKPERKRPLGRTRLDG
jgi:hypothetical protein